MKRLATLWGQNGVAKYRVDEPCGLLVRFANGLCVTHVCEEAGGYEMDVVPLAGGAGESSKYLPAVIYGYDVGEMAFCAAYARHAMPTLLDVIEKTIREHETPREEWEQLVTKFMRVVFAQTQRYAKEQEIQNPDAPKHLFAIGVQYAGWMILSKLLWKPKEPT